MIERIDELHVFVRAVEAGSLSAAGRSLRISANQASRKVARLEDRLGVQLLVRTTRRMSVTEEGQRLYVRSRRILDEVSGIETDVGPSRDLKGTVRIAVPAICLHHGLLEDLQRLHVDHPKLRIDLVVADPAPDPLEGGCDISVHVGQLDSGVHFVRSLGVVVPILAAAPSYVSRFGMPTSPGQLREHACLRLVQAGVAQTQWRLLDREGAATTVTVDGPITTDDRRALIDGLRHGLGLGRVSEHILAQGLVAGTMVRVLPSHSFEPLPVVAVVPKGRQRLVRVKRMLALLRDVVSRSDRPVNPDGSPPGLAG